MDCLLSSFLCSFFENLPTLEVLLWYKSLYGRVKQHILVSTSYGVLKGGKKNTFLAFAANLSCQHHYGFNYSKVFLVPGITHRK